MTLEGLPQEESSQELIVQPGPEDQVGEVSVGTPPEVGVQSARTYTQEEWDTQQRANSEWRANGDRQIAEARHVAAEMSMREQIAQSEAQAAAYDRQSIADGDITPNEAEQRQQQRQHGVQQAVSQYRATVQARADNDSMRAETNNMARMKVADLLAKEHGVEMEALLSDRTLTTGEGMEMKARELSVHKRETKLKGAETFDSGQRGAVPGNINAMSPEEKINWALAHPSKRAR
jgi:hypothetical protein